MNADAGATFPKLRGCLEDMDVQVWMGEEGVEEGCARHTAACDGDPDFRGVGHLWMANWSDGTPTGCCYKQWLVYLAVL